jgi:DNA-binding transcriptional LysR family regulator
MSESDLNDIRRFITVARAGSLTSAAKDLRLPVSSVARSMTRLEGHLGLLLMHRGPRGLTLTEEGKLYLDSCRKTLRRLTVTEESLHQEHSHPRGLIRIMAPTTTAHTVLVPILPEFLRCYPDVRVKLLLYASDWDQDLREDIDVLFKIGPSKSSSRRIRRYPDVRTALFASKTYLAQAGTPRNPEELRRHSCIGSMPWALTKGRSKQTIAPSFRVMAEDPLIFREMLLNNVGIARLPCHLAFAKSVETKLVRVLPDWEGAPISHSAIFIGPSHLTPRIQVFLDFVQRYFGTDLDPRLSGRPPDTVFVTGDSLRLMHKG